MVFRRTAALYEQNFRLSEQHWGKPASLTGAQMAELKALVLQGPDPEKHGVVRWRCVDLRAEVARRFTVEVTERTIGKWLRKLDLTRLQPRPFHPKKDEAAQATFKNVWPAPSASVFGDPSEQSASTYPASGLCPGQMEIRAPRSS
jgi:transposase